MRHRLDTKQFGRVAAQTARNIIRQGIRDSERDQMMQEFKGRHQELVSALVERVDPKTGALSLKIGKAEAILPKGEQVGTENVKEGDHVQVYVVDVKETEKGPKAIISRTHPDLIRRLFEKEVPEIFDGTVEIKAVAREAGSRTKIAVMSHNPDVDAVGACIGTRGTRVSDIVNELGGEKMDIVDYSEDPAKVIAAALAPATVLSVETAEDGLADSIKPRLLAANADCAKVLVSNVSDTPLTMRDARLEQAIIETNAKLVVLDPIQGFLGADVDMHRANEIRPIMKHISELAE